MSIEEALTQMARSNSHNDTNADRERWKLLAFILGEMCAALGVDGHHDEGNEP
jgi:hypothetical protein